MATITIRNLDDALKIRLRIRAASHDRSMEEEARIIIKDVLQTKDATDDLRGLGSLIHKRFMSVGGVDLALPARDQSSRKPDNLE